MNLSIGQNMKRAKKKNRALILQEILRSGPVSRNQLANTLKLTPSSITYLTAELIDEGMIREVGTLDSAQVGRKSIALALTSEAIYVIGVHIGAQETSIGLVNWTGKMVAHSVLHEGPITSATSLIQTVNTAIANMRSDFSDANIVGIGLGAHGLVSPAEGKLVLSSNPALRSIDVIGPVQSQFDIPVVLDNNVRGIALAETMYGIGREFSDFIYIFIGYGLGSALVVSRRLYAGDMSISNEFGHMTYDPDGELCWCGNRGCLGHYASPNELIKRLGLDTEFELLQKIAAGDTETIQALRSAATKIGTALASVINLVNIHRVVLGGSMVENSNSPFLEEIRNVVPMRSVVARVSPVEISTATLRTPLGPTGAASLFLATKVFEM